MSGIFEDGTSDDSEWVSISDLMAGLMLIFLFIAIIYIRVQVADKEKAIAESRALATTQEQIQEIVVTWQRSSEEIVVALQDEFRDDLDRWNAEIDADNLTIRFKAPDVLFEEGKAELQPRFKDILRDFFPRYLRVLREYLDVIDEVRIEGHSSSEWIAGMDPVDAFFRNMKLSQDRTRSVLEFSLTVDGTQNDRAWALSRITANGLSSSRLVFREDGTEDRFASRRVEFKVRTKTEEQIVRILESIQ